MEIVEGIRSKSGYTIIEMVVVMAIMAVLAGISLSYMYLSRDKNFVLFSVQKLEADIRTQFVNAISVKEITTSSGNCAGTAQVPRLRTIRIPVSPTGDFDTYEFVEYCETTGASPWLNSVIAPSITKTVKLSEEAGYKKSLLFEFDLSNTLGAFSEASSGYLHLIFSSPYGRFYAAYTPSAQPNLNVASTSGIWSKDPKNYSYSAIDYKVSTGTDLQVNIRKSNNANVNMSFRITRDGNIKNN